MTHEKDIKKMIINELDNMFKGLNDFNFRELDKNQCDVSQEKADEIESIFMSFRNVIAGTEWDGEKREFETYKI